MAALQSDELLEATPEAEADAVGVGVADGDGAEVGGCACC